MKNLDIIFDRFFLHTSQKHSVPEYNNESAGEIIPWLVIVAPSYKTTAVFSLSWHFLCIERNVYNFAAILSACVFIFLNCSQMEADISLDRIRGFTLKILHV